MIVPTYIREQITQDSNLLAVFGYEGSVTKSYPQKKQRDVLSFMGTFTFPKIEDFKKSLTKTKKYTKKQISEIIEGLQDLPEYQGDKC